MLNLKIDNRAIEAEGIHIGPNVLTSQFEVLHNIAPARQSENIVKQLHSEPELTIQQKAQEVFRTVQGDIVTEIFGEENFQDPDISRMFDAAKGKNVRDPAVIAIVNRLYEDWAGPNAKYGF